MIILFPCPCFLCIVALVYFLLMIISFLSHRFLRMSLLSDSPDYLAVVSPGVPPGMYIAENLPPTIYSAVVSKNVSGYKPSNFRR